ncbi:MAG: peptidase M17 [Candidatus Eisenbacteria bacterium]|nr:peptidase M17 [Candidatus Eisenbacteria bacterium]
MAARAKRSRRRPSRLARAAQVAMGEIMKVRKNERVVIVTNPEDDVLSISAALYDASLDRGADAVVIIQPRRTSLEMASDAVIYAMRSEPDVMISISAAKFGKDRFGLQKPYRFQGVRGRWTHIYDALRSSGRSRAFWSPSVTEDMFVRTVPVDYAQMRRRAAKLKRRLDRAERVRVVAPGGTDLEVGLREREAFPDDGSFSKPGSGGNLPAGEVYISPKNYDADGVLVFDGSLSEAQGGAFVPRKPVWAEVRGGLITKLSGGAGARRLEASLRAGEAAARKMKGKPGWSQKRIASYAKNARHLGELGIGLNPAARVTGNMLEDEKILGTCHFAIGANYDDDAEAFIHLDCLVKKPTIMAISPAGREKVIVRDGQPV